MVASRAEPFDEPRGMRGPLRPPLLCQRGLAVWASVLGTRFRGFWERVATLQCPTTRWDTATARSRLSGVEFVEAVADVVGLAGVSDALRGPLTWSVGVDRPHLHAVGDPWRGHERGLGCG